MQNWERAKAELEAILSQPVTAEVTDEQLLDLFLALPKKIRDAHFVTTAHVAEIADVSQRTVQLWIESGFIRAVSIGKKYKVSISSLREYLRTRNHDKALQQRS